LSDQVPLNLGLAPLASSPEDDQLLFNFRILTAMDRVSLSLCCGKSLFQTMDDIHPQPGQVSQDGPLRDVAPQPPPDFREIVARHVRGEAAECKVSLVEVRGES